MNWSSTNATKSSGRRQHSIAQSFESLLTAIEVISFDLFDTLVHRKQLFVPKDLFYFMQEQAQRQLGLLKDDFIHERVRAEENVRVRAWGRGVKEITLQEIYAELGRILRIEDSV